MNGARGKLPIRIGIALGVCCLICVVLIWAGWSTFAAVLTAWASGAAIVPLTVWALSRRDCLRVPCEGAARRSATKAGRAHGEPARGREDHAELAG